MLSRLVINVRCESKEKDLLFGDSPTTGLNRNPSHQKQLVIKKSTTVDNVNSIQTVDFMSHKRPSHKLAKAKFRLVTAIYMYTTTQLSPLPNFYQR